MKSICRAYVADAVTLFVGEALEAGNNWRESLDGADRRSCHQQHVLTLCIGDDRQRLGREPILQARVENRDAVVFEPCVITSSRALERRSVKFNSDIAVRFKSAVRTADHGLSMAQRLHSIVMPTPI